jgi:predicted nucleotidyltransferase
MLNIISSNNKAVREIFKTHKVEKAFIFGSALTERFDENSDLDFLVQFKDDLSPLEKGELWWNLQVLLTLTGSRTLSGF